MAFISPYSDIADADVLRYDFITEISPGVWKVYDKTDRSEWLAHDMSDSFATNSEKPTPQNRTAFRHLLETEQRRVLNPMVTILSHDSLVRLKDWITVGKPQVGGNVQYRSYAVWDYCDAGVLRNLLVSRFALHPPTEKKYPDQDEEKRPVENSDDPDKFELEPFLPESLCWHVLISIMKALAWLHDGSWEVFTDENGQYMMDPEVDWEPILHRNINPNNIFFQHPDATESYGACKLGNYGNLYISGHHPATDSEPSKERHFSKALAPHPLTKFAPLEELVEEDAEFGYSYPQWPGQPYTLISELRALGEILQSMMLRPYHNPKDGMTLIRQSTVEENIGHTTYSAPLKNMVVMLMTYNPDEKLADGSYRQQERGCFTSMMCVVAHEGFRDWKKLGSPEATKATLRHTVIEKHQWNAMVQQVVERMRKDAIQKVQKKDVKVEKSLFAIPKPKPQSLDHLQIVSSNHIVDLPPEVVGITKDDKEFTMEYIKAFIDDEIFN